MTIEIPEIYGAPDDDVFADGRAVDAFQLRSVANMANRLMGAKSQMFSMAWGVNQISGVPDYYPYQVTVDTQWFPVVPPFTVRKKPGTTLADFYFRAITTAACRFQVVTLARPLQTAPVNGAAGVYEASSGTNEAYIAPIPVADGTVERISLWATAAGAGTTATDYLGGSPATGDVIGISPGQFLIEGDGGAALSYVITGAAAGEFANAGFSFDLKAPAGATINPGGLLARWKILGVGQGPAAGQRVIFVRLSTDQLFRWPREIGFAAGSDPFQYEITEGALIAMTGFAAATEERTG